MLTGTTPFPEKRLRSAGFGEMQRIIAEEEPERPSTRLSTMENDQRTTVARDRSMELSALGRLLRGDLDWIAMKCLEKDRARRYETVNGLEADIQRHLSNEPIIARPPSAAYRFQKMVRRNKVAFAGAAAVATALLIGIAGMTALYLQAQQNLYVANMNLAQQAWEQNNVGRVRQLLAETAEFPERGFEWYYWWQQTHQELRTLFGHLFQVDTVAFSPDGQRIVTGSWDRTAKVWDVFTGKVMLTLKGHITDITSVAFSPDGRRIVTGSRDRTAKVWDTITGKVLLTLKGHSDWISSVTFSPDSQRIVTGSGDQTAKVWDAANGKELLALKGHSAAIRSVAISPDGQRIVTGSEDKTAKVWEAASSKELLTLIGHSSSIRSVAISPDGRRIVTGSSDSTAKVWESPSGNELLTLKGHSAPIDSVAYAADGQRIVTGSRDSTAKVWDAADGNELFSLKGHDASISSVAYSADSQRIVTGSWDRTAKVWDAAVDKKLSTLKVERVQSGLINPTFRTARARSKQWLADAVASRRFDCVCTSPDGQRVATSSGLVAHVREAATGNELLTLKGHSAAISSVVFSPDGQRIVTSGVDGTVKVWEAASPEQVAAWQKEEQAAAPR